MEQTPGMVKLEGENGGPPTEAMDYDLLLDTVSPPSSPTPSTLDALYSPLFFELANAPTIRYACATADDDDSDGGEGEGEAEAEGGQGKVPRHVVVSQDTNAAETTGGIVWESGYLLTRYLLSLPGFQGLTMLDVGSGPGLLGLACAASKGLRKTVLSECEQKGEDGGETGALPLLRRNVDRYNGALGGDQAGGAKAKAVALDWLAPREAYEGEFDFVTGSDVIFNEALSRPLLETLSLYTKSKKRGGICYLCCQVRCEAAHDKLLGEGGEWFDEVQEISEEVWAVEGCEWGKGGGCRVWRMVGGKKRLGHNEKVKKKEERKEKKNNERREKRRREEGGGRAEGVKKEAKT
ncbi:hypothetical protein TeGR_g1678 [Tetraparma gracilis]|uniref:Uncharacterized protein n=1 Tax=Tetraparma gracilis TaxID=2962635 RepID=A0ABQ6N7T1_9STRA|nr:hypothetical protein TeGR_g1678 [Tetraparma gracilis]